MAGLKLLLLLGIFSQDKPQISQEEFAQRRGRIMKAVGKGVAVLDTAPLSSRPGANVNTALFHFKYLTGFHDDQGILVLAGDKAYIFVSDEKKAKRFGFTEVYPAAEFPTWAKGNLAPFIKASVKLRHKNLLIVRKYIPTIYAKLGRFIDGMRMIKSPMEIRLIQKATDATCAAHREILKMIKPGINEKEVQKTIESTFRKNGCNELGFPSICGSGKNGTILHYSTNKNVLPENSLIVCDIGASTENYVSDVTRTLPTSGKFTKEQRKAYQVVLDAQKAAEKILKPGVTIRDLHWAAAGYMRAAQYSKWSFAYAPSRSGVRHGIGHYVGMAVHDSGRTNMKLKPGMIITIEPGWYDKEAGWGIRIEDVYLLTKDGFERLSKSAPREIAAIEKAMSER